MSLSINVFAPTTIFFFNLIPFFIITLDPIKIFFNSIVVFVILSLVSSIIFVFIPPKITFSPRYKFFERFTNWLCNY